MNTSGAMKRSFILALYAALVMAAIFVFYVCIEYVCCLRSIHT